MTTVQVSRTIAAPASLVFDTVANIANLPNVSADVLNIEFLSEQRSGVGTRFRETRRHKNKEMLTDLSVTEYVLDQRVRMVTDSHGTVWDSVFELSPEGEATALCITMQATAHACLPRLLNPLMKGMFRRGLAAHLETVKAHCETEARRAPLRSQAGAAGA